MDTDLPNCPFCQKQIEIDQEDHESFIVFCKSRPCDDFYMNQRIMAGETPEIALDKFKQFLVELEAGSMYWKELHNGE